MAQLRREPDLRLSLKIGQGFDMGRPSLLLAQLLPQARFAFILREPVARAFSNWSRTRSQGLETLPFETAVELDDRSRDGDASRR